MRLWSLHPRYLDTKGLVAVWREGLLALHVLSGKTKGYTKHPQLIRFQAHEHPQGAIAFYLHAIVDEAEERGYHFDRSKLSAQKPVNLIPVTSEQIAYETQHLLQKLETRDAARYNELITQTTFLPHPLFSEIDGEIESWEKRK